MTEPNDEVHVEITSAGAANGEHPGEPGSITISGPSELLQRVLDSAKIINEMQQQRAYWENECRDALVNAQRAGCGCLVTLKPLTIAANIFVPEGQIMIVQQNGFGTIEN